MVAAIPSAGKGVARALQGSSVTLEVMHFGGYAARMPTVNPRLTVTLTAKSAAQLRELSSLTQQSQSSIVAELLEESEPILDRMIQVLRAAESAKAALKERTASDLASAQAKVEAQLGLMLDAFDAASLPLLRDIEKVVRRGRKDGGDAPLGRTPAALRPVLTPPSNRGVRLTHKAGKTQTKSRG